MRRVDSLEKTLMLGGIRGRRRRGRQRKRWLDGITDSMDVWVNSGSWWWTGRPGVLQFMELQRVRQDWVTGLNWTQELHSPHYGETTLLSGIWIQSHSRLGLESTTPDLRGDINSQSFNSNRTPGAWSAGSFVLVQNNQEQKEFSQRQSNRQRGS